MTRLLTTQDISWFLDLHEKGQLDLDPPYQRRSVWSSRDKRFFIDTVLNDYPAPPVFLHKTLDDSGHATYHVVDGKQRLQTIIDFRDNKIRIPDDFSDITLQKQRWKDLRRDMRVKFWNYELSVEMLPDVTESAIRSIFERINRNSRRLTPQEMRHAKYEGWFITFVEGEAENAEEWRGFGVVTTARSKRMMDVQFISELCAVVLKGKILGFDQNALDDLYAEYEDTTELGMFVEDDFVAEIHRLKRSIAELLRLKSELKDALKVQSHFYSLWTYLHLEKERFPDIKDFVDRYQTFMTAVQEALVSPDPRVGIEMVDRPLQKAVLEYADSARGASTDLTPRKMRHMGLVTGIHGPTAAAHEDS